MSGGSTMTKDFMKMQSFNSDAQSCVENNNGDPSISCLEKGAMKEHKKTGMKLTKDMNQTICLFQKYLLAKTQHNIGKTNMEESEFIKRCTSRPLVPPKFGCNQPRRISLLEQALLPRINRHDATQADASSDDKSSTAQLTIFYSGTINVYDDIPADKVQAIMLLASESTSTNLATKKVPKTNVTTPTHQSNFPSVCKLQAGNVYSQLQDP
ncbi:hypothetical protein L1049_015705 [Liquidambar formosana]|uniref:Protein TIFY n=1 Tax=Liquidambar formosana TaxID=63359 RepID=A0AAP0RYI4_LIQFO